MIAAITTKGEHYQHLYINMNIKKMGIKILDQYAVLGDYDFITIVEAEDSTIIKMVIELFSRGTIKPITYRLVRCTSIS